MKLKWLYRPTVQYTGKDNRYCTYNKAVFIDVLLTAVVCVFLSAQTFVIWCWDAWGFSIWHYTTRRLYPKTLEIRNVQFSRQAKQTWKSAKNDINRVGCDITCHVFVNCQFKCLNNVFTPCRHRHFTQRLVYVFCEH